MMIFTLNRGEMDEEILAAIARRRPSKYRILYFYTFYKILYFFTRVYNIKEISIKSSNIDFETHLGQLTLFKKHNLF
jgi:hypothetical protein